MFNKSGKRWLKLLATIFSLTLIAAACGSTADTGTADAEEPAEETSEAEADSEEEEAMEDEEEEAMEDEDDSDAADGSDDPVVAAAIEFVEGQLSASEGFDGPADGPSALADQSIIFVAADLTNGGIAAVDSSAVEAAAAIGWDYETVDGRGTVQGRSDALGQAIAQAPDGIILGGFDATEQQAAIEEAEAQGIPIVGWHAAADVGPAPDRGLFNNVTTDPLEVSEFAGRLAIAQSGGQLGAVIFTDSQFEVAVAKADAIAETLAECAGCEVFRIEDSPIAETDARMPGVISSLLNEFGDDLTHLLAINDNYFGGSAPALRDAGLDGVGPPFAISAGDGDAAAFNRIRTEDFQFATVAEPLLLQGWQIIDELNRALQGEAASDFVAPPAIVTAENITDADVFDPDSGYRDNYLSIWGVG